MSGIFHTANHGRTAVKSERHLKLHRDDRKKWFLSKKDKTFSQQDKLQSSHHEKIKSLFITVLQTLFLSRMEVPAHLWSHLQRKNHAPSASSLDHLLSMSVVVQPWCHRMFFMSLWVSRMAFADMQETGREKWIVIEQEERFNDTSWCAIKIYMSLFPLLALPPLHLLIEYIYVRIGLVYYISLFACSLENWELRIGSLIDSTEMRERQML